MESINFDVEKLNLELLRKKFAFQHGEKLIIEKEYTDEKKRKYLDLRTLPDVLPVQLKHDIEQPIVEEIKEAV
jgi:hypothetical protein